MGECRSTVGTEAMQLGNKILAQFVKQDDWPRDDVLLQMALDNKLI